MTTNIQPLHDRVIVKRIDEGEQVRGGIIIPDTAKEKPQEGEVIAAGLGKYREDGSRQALDVQCWRPRVVRQVRRLRDQGRRRRSVDHARGRDSRNYQRAARCRLPAARRANSSGANANR